MRMMRRCFGMRLGSCPGELGTSNMLVSNNMTIVPALRVPTQAEVYPLRDMYKASAVTAVIFF